MFHENFQVGYFGRGVDPGGLVPCPGRGGAVRAPAARLDTQADTILVGAVWSRLTRLTRIGAPVAFLAPSLIFLLAFTYWPILHAFFLGFFRWNINTPHRVFAGLTNYRELLIEPLFRQVLLNNIYYGLLAIPVAMAIALFLAIQVNKRFAGCTWYRTIFFYPTMIPMVAAAMIWVWMLNPGYGPVNYYLKMLGLPAPEWLYSMEWAMPAIIMVSLWKHIGYFMIIYLAGLQNIPDDLYEAAALEGAGPWVRFRVVTWPCLSPTTYFLFIIAIITTFQVFDQVYIMTQGGPAHRTNVLVYYIYQNAFQFWDMGKASALTTVQIVLLFCLVWGASRVLRMRVHYQ